jgi:hypothetical protein
MKKQQGNESNKMILEAYYAGIGEAHIDNIICDLEKRKDEIEAVEVPESLDKWFFDYIEKEKRVEKRKKLFSNSKQFSKRAAILILVLIAAMSALMFTVEAVRVRVLNFFIERNEKYTEVRIDEEGGDLTPNQDWESYYIPEYLPEGYFFESSEAIGSLKVLKYTNEENHIIFTQANNGTDIQLDTEDAVVEEVNLDGKEGMIITEGDRVMLFWYNEEASFTLIGHEDKEEILKAAESVEKVEE